MTTVEWLNFGLAVAALVLHSPRLAAVVKAAAKAAARKPGAGS